MERQTSVSFICQRCSMPVRLDDTILNPNEHTLAELSLPIYPATESDLGSGAGSFDKVVPPVRWTESCGSNPAAGGADSTGFTVLSDPGVTPSGHLSHKVKMAATLFDMLSTSTEVDHPMCEECTDLVTDGLEEELVTVRKEAALYREFVQKLRREPPADDGEAALDAELAKLATEEQQLLGELRTLKQEEQQLQHELEQQDKEKERLEQEEEQFWREFCTYRKQLIVADEDYRSLSNRLDYTTRQLEKLKKTNVFNATFHIWHSGHFGTINNFRLGRLPSVPVDWWEINAAWGQTALLLTALARKIGLQFSKYKIVPFGNHSYVQVLADGRELPLYGAGGFKFIWNPKFDAAMVAFLECLQELQEKIESGDAKFRLPYRVSKGKIEDPQAGTAYSVKIQLNSEEHWTKALKYMLTNLKWGIAWVCADSTLGELAPPEPGEQT
ncbi:Beclin-1-like protein [Amphibalanus amphitrite]|uniref:Beclin-1-like protein n=1 Tax=Amphibalanus amphitrite TaxID=1232801 RepID=A0A6A4VTU4_AMPAM|nr:Beclin-1-like protein [Amphibalanus amphitrite]